MHSKQGALLIPVTGMLILFTFEQNHSPSYFLLLPSREHTAQCGLALPGENFKCHYVAKMALSPIKA